MDVHDFLDDDLRGRAALFVLGSLGPDEARAHRLHLVACDACRREADSLERIARDLTLLAPEVEPGPHLWARVQARVRGLDATPAGGRAAHERASSTQIWKRWTERAGAADFTFLAAADGPFEPTAVQGVEARRLFVDAQNDRVTMLVRMAPGAAYPAHVHAGPEECYVLSGDLRVGSTHMASGDFQHADTGSTHDIQSTEHGCVLLLVSSLRDELV